jgi:hypothetical protein|tara:strand:+ start:37130 stop:37525 length:396 start_codon:yes stop_codon:yes gene_type:complete
MPQMDFSTFFPQVFWLITLIGFSFFYLLRGFFSYSIMILKLRGRYISSFFIFFITFFLKMFNEFVIFIRTTVFKFSGILFRNKFFYESFNNLLSYFTNKNSYYILKRQSFQSSSFSTGFLFFSYFFNNLED